MDVGYRDVLFLAVVLGGTGIMGAGLLRSSGSPSAQPRNSLAVRSDSERSSTRWTHHFVTAGPSKSCAGPRRRRSWP